VALPPNNESLNKSFIICQCFIICGTRDAVPTLSLFVNDSLFVVPPSTYPTNPHSCPLIFLPDADPKKKLVQSLQAQITCVNVDKYFLPICDVGCVGEVISTWKHKIMRAPFGPLFPPARHQTSTSYPPTTKSYPPTSKSYPPTSKSYPPIFHLPAISHVPVPADN
jgi:hypothetical protein